MEGGRAWISTIRWRAAAWVLGIALATVATVMFTGIAVLPAVGVAAAAAVMSINRVATRLAKPVCLGCGLDMTGQPMGPAGAACPSCGLIHQPRPDDAAAPALAVDDDADEDEPNASGPDAATT
ncbi:MAG: hypothetical protein AB7Q91_13500 [Phycisphaerales bacterium]